MATERVQIVVTSKGTVTVKREIESIGTTAKKSATGIDLLKGAIAGISAGYLANEFIKYSDSATRLSNSLRMAGLSGEVFTDTQDRLYGAAIKNGQVAEDLAKIYQKMDAVQGELGITQESTISAVEGIAAAMKLSTAGTAAQSGALQQLSQLLGGTMVQAQEYNSLIDGAYPLLQAVANGSDRWAGSVAKLTQDVKASNVATTDFFNALRIGLADTEKLAASIPLTIGQSFVSLGQAFTQWIASSNSANVVSRALASAVQFLAENMSTLAPIIVLAGAAIVTAFVGSAMVTAISMVGALAVGVGNLALSVALAIPRLIAFTFALATNPVVLMTAAIAGLAAGLAYLVVYLTQGEEGLNAFKESAKQAAEDIKTYFSSLFLFEDGKNPVVEFRAEKAAADLTKAADAMANKLSKAVGGADLTKGLDKSLDKGGDELKKGVEKGSQAGAKELAKAGESSANKMGQTFEKAAQKQTNINDVFVAKFEGTGRNIFDLWNNWGNAFVDDFQTTIGDLLVQYQRAMTENLEAQAELFKAQAEQTRLETEYMERYGSRMGTASAGGSGDGGNERDNRTTTGTSTFGPFAKGGGFRVPGSGGTDSRKVQFRATPGETVEIKTPAQRAKEAAAAKTAKPVEQKAPTVLNLFDPKAIAQALNSAEGSDVLINVVRAKRDELAEILGVV